jgi:hypothetical protein
MARKRAIFLDSFNGGISKDFSQRILIKTKNRSIKRVFCAPVISLSALAVSFTPIQSFRSYEHVFHNRPISFSVKYFFNDFLMFPTK